MRIEWSHELIYRITEFVLRIDVSMLGSYIPFEIPR